MSYHVVHGEHEFSYDSIQGVIQQLVDSEYPFDPTEDEDVQIFLNEVLFNQHSDLELARYELRELRNELAVIIAEWDYELRQQKNKQYKNWTVWYGED